MECRPKEQLMGKSIEFGSSHRYKWSIAIESHCQAADGGQLHHRKRRRPGGKYWMMWNVGILCKEDEITTYLLHGVVHSAHYYVKMMGLEL